MPDDHRYFLRSKSKSQSTQTECLSTIVFTEQGLALFSDLIPECDLNNYWVPAVWPVGKEQRGQCCGLYALDTGLDHGFGRADIPTPPARKNGKKNVVSLREFAKQKSLSAFGEIFSVKSLKKIADHFKFPNCEIIKPNQHDEESYTKTICDKLRNECVIVTSLDMKGSFPSAAKGLGTHWVLIFGYVYHEGECFFLASQWGLNFLFPAKKLFLSNQQLPHDNPRVYPDYIYYKNAKKGTEYYRKKTKRDHIESMDVRYAIGDTLEEFRFSLFCIPVVDAPSCVDLKKWLMEEGIKPKCST